MTGLQTDSETTMTFVRIKALTGQEGEIEIEVMPVFRLLF